MTAKIIKADTAGEQLFLDYLARFGIHCERWSKVGGKQPDWLVKTSAQEIVVENKDIEWGKADEERVNIALAHGGACADVAGFSVGKTHDKLIDALDKLSAIPADMAYMPVIYNNSGHSYTNDVCVIQALYGPTQLSVLVNSEGAQSDMWHEPKESMTEEYDERFGFFGRLSSSRRVSAVAVIWEKNNRHSNFTDYVLDYVMSGKQRTDLSPDENHALLEQEFAKQYISLPQLCVYHNPFATVPLSSEVFAFDSNCRQVWYDHNLRTFTIYGDDAPLY